jgi:hypothetical protein
MNIGLPENGGGERWRARQGKRKRRFRLWPAKG